jgi:hypothetical protein
MLIAAFYNSDTVEGILSAYCVRLKYYGQFDSDGNQNEVDLYDVSGVLTGTIDSTIYAITDATLHRVFDFCADATGTGTIDATQRTALDGKLIGSAGDDLSDDSTIFVAPAEFAASLRFEKNQAQMVWEGLFSYKGNPTYKAEATSGGNNTLTDTASVGWTTDKFAGYYLYILSGTGYGQYRKILSNTATTGTETITVDSNWDTNPASGSVYIITPYPPKPYAIPIKYCGGLNAQLNYGTASGGTTADLDDAGIGWTINAYADKYVFIYEGTGIGQSSKITSNTNTKLVFTTAMAVAPDNTSKYVIIDRATEILWNMYNKWFLWVNAWDLTNNDDLTVLKKLFDDNQNINGKEVQVPGDINWPYFTDTVLVQGSSMFNAAIYAPLP